MRKHLRGAILVLAFTAPAAAQSTAQSWDSVKALTAGESVRVTAGSGTVSGPLQIATDDSLTVGTGQGSQIFTRQQISRVSVKKQNHRGRNTLIGLSVGAAAGAGAAAAAHGSNSSSGFNFGSRGAWAGAGAAIFGVLGAIVGAVIPTGGWQDVYKP